MPATYTLIASNVLAGSTASVTFSAIPQTFTDLVLRLSARNATAANNMPLGIRVNNLSTTIYSGIYIQGTGSAVGTSSNSNQTELSNNTITAANHTADTFTSLEFYLPNYGTSDNKPVSGISTGENNATSALVRVTANLIRTSAAISSISLFELSSTNFVAGSSFYLYGIKNS